MAKIDKAILFQVALIYANKDKKGERKELDTLNYVCYNKNWDGEQNNVL